MPNQNIQAPRLSYSKVKSPRQFKGNQINAIKLNSLPTVKRIVKKLSSTLGAQVVTTNAQGQGQATWKALSGAASVTANVTNHLGATSETQSEPFALNNQKRMESSLVVELSSQKRMFGMQQLLKLGTLSLALLTCQLASPMNFIRQIVNGYSVIGTVNGSNWKIKVINLQQQL